MVPILIQMNPIHIFFFFKIHVYTIVPSMSGFYIQSSPLLSMSQLPPTSSSLIWAHKIYTEESILRRQQSPTQSTNSIPFIEAEGSLPCLQVSTKGSSLSQINPVYTFLSSTRFTSILAFHLYPGFLTGFFHSSYLVKTMWSHIHQASSLSWSFSYMVEKTNYKASHYETSSGLPLLLSYDQIFSYAPCSQTPSVSCSSLHVTTQISHLYKTACKKGKMQMNYVTKYSLYIMHTLSKDNLADYISSSWGVYCMSGYKIQSEHTCSCTHIHPHRCTSSSLYILTVERF